VKNENVKSKILKERKKTVWASASASGRKIIFIYLDIFGFLLLQVNILINTVKMNSALIDAVPIKSHEMHNHHFDSTKWNNFPFREDDVIVATAYKSGTTWVQNILVQLMFQGREIPANTTELYPWLDLRFPPAEVQIPLIESQTERRQLKTHLRLDALVFSPKAKYIYVGRDGRDCYMSLINHYRSSTDLLYHALNDTPGRVGPELPHFKEEEHSDTKLIDRWISEGWPSTEGETDGWPFW
jgi:aryl sulfotransferase